MISKEGAILPINDPPDLILAGTERLRVCLVPTSHRSATLRPALAGLGLEEDMASYADKCHKTCKMVVIADDDDVVDCSRGKTLWTTWDFNKVTHDG